MSETLKPCPFCGHDTPEFERLGTPRQSCIVICGNCGARHESSDEGDRCGQSWNERADAAEIDRLRAIAKDAADAATEHQREVRRLRAQVAAMQSQGYDLALLVMRLARRMRHAREGRGHRAGDDALVHAATDYLHRKGLISPLRAADEGRARESEGQG